MPCIAVDAMGGDSGLQVTVPGAVQAARDTGISVRLVGDEALIRAELGKLDVSGLDIDVEHTSQVVGMEDKPSEVLRRKKDSSIHVAMRMVKEGRADGVVSAGNSGATMACGSQPCSGTSAALTPTPAISSQKIRISAPRWSSTRPWTKPVAVNSSVPARLYSQRVPASSRAPPVRV